MKETIFGRKVEEPKADVHTVEVPVEEPTPVPQPSPVTSPKKVVEILQIAAYGESVTAKIVGLGDDKKLYAFDFDRHRWMELGNAIFEV